MTAFVPAEHPRAAAGRFAPTDRLEGDVVVLADPVAIPSGAVLGRDAANDELARMLNDEELATPEDLGPDYEMRWSGEPFGSGDLPDRFVIATAEPSGMPDPSGLVGHYLSGEGGMGGEFYGSPEPLGATTVGTNGETRAQAWMWGIDLTKSRRDDVGMALDGFHDQLVDGSPVRKTDRAGAGTKGTRKWLGLGEDISVAWGEFRRR